MSVFGIAHLPSGRRHELDSIGVTVIGHIEPPKYKSFRESMDEIIYSVLRGETTTYNPSDPKWEKTPKLFAAVKRYLPRRPGLQLCLSINSSLDFYHKIDMFFLWKGVYVTIDLSLRWQEELEIPQTVDIMENLSDFDDEAFNVLGKQVANIL